MSSLNMNGVGAAEYCLPKIDYSRHPAYCDQRHSNEDRVSILEEFRPIVANKRKIIQSCAEIYSRRVVSHSDTKVDRLARDGAVALTIEKSHISAIRDAAKAAEASLRTQIFGKRRLRLKFRETQYLVHSDTEPCSGFETLEAVVRRVILSSGALDIASAYFGGQPARIGRVMFRINVPQQPFCTRMFSDPAIPHPKTTGMHIDCNGRPMLNGNIYLSEVGLENGPTGNVKGSNHWQFDIEDRAIRKSFDDRMVRESTERKLMALPEELRRRANFGHEIEDGTVLSDLLLSAERRYTSEDGNLVLFDADAVHRGGDVLSGERVAVLFCIRMGNEAHS